MEIKLFGTKDVRRPGDLQILPVFAEEEPTFEGEARELWKELQKEGVFTGKAGQTHSSRIREFGTYRRVFLAGLGDRHTVRPETFGLAVAAGVRGAMDAKCPVVDLVVPREITGTDYYREAGKAMVLAGYRFDRYKAPDPDESRQPVELVQLVTVQPEEANLLAAHGGMTLGRWVNRARDLVNQPANRQSPSDLAEEALRIGRETGMDVEVLGEKKIAALGMKAFLAVADASRQEPALIVMRYRGDEEHPERILGLAGKGIVYDTGGLSLKPTSGMLTMKTDMAGAAAVMGAMGMAAAEGLRLNITAVVAACENAMGPSGYRPGDILDTMAGKTVFVANTDAEGRLTLADAVYYLSSVEGAEQILDVATLTGAAEVALGMTVAAGISTDDGFYGQVEEAARAGGEKLWRLPAFDEYKELNKADDADLSNAGGRTAGAITAGLFVGEFTEGKPWVHLDIAGPSWTEKPNPLQTKGATGYGVSLLVSLAQSLAVSRKEPDLD